MHQIHGAVADTSGTIGPATEQATVQWWRVSQPASSAADGLARHWQFARMVPQYVLGRP